MHGYHFFVSPENFKGNRAYLIGNEFYHCCHVLRKKPGDHIIIFDGVGHAYRTAINHIENNQAIVELIEPIAAARPFSFNISLGFGLIKSRALDTLITQASALGVNDLFPLKTRHGVKQNFKKERYSKKALMAAKQAGNYWLPQVHSLTDLSVWLPKVNPQTIRIIALQNTMTTLWDIWGKNKLSRDIILLVGPEGGWHKTEIEQTQKAGFIPANIFPLRLRSEVAITTLIAELYMIKLKEKQHG